MNWIIDLRKELNIPHTLKELIEDNSRLEEMSKMALKDPSTGGNPIKLSQEDFDEAAMKRIATSVKNFMPYIELGDFESRVGKIDEVTGVAATLILITYSVPTAAVSNKKLEVELQPIS